MDNKFQLYKKYIFNINYKLRTDINRVLICNNDSLIIDAFNTSLATLKKTYQNGFYWLMHPYIAILISYFDGSKTLKETIQQIANDMDLSFEEVTKSVEKFIENTENMFYPIMDLKTSLAVPKQLIVENNDGLIRDNILKDIDIEYITEHLDLKQRRLNIPVEMTILLQTDCYTRCKYCYVDKKYKVEKTLSFEKIKDLIKEARTLNMRECAIHGGDLFVYKHWYELLCFLKENNYFSMLSTKYPLQEDDVKKLAALGYKKIQISLDSINSDTLSKIIGVDATYFDKIDNTLHLLQKYNIKFNVKGVVTKFNDTIEEIDALIHYLLKFDNLVDISIAPGECSMHSDFNSFRTNRENLELIRQYIEKLNYEQVHMQDYLRNVYNEKEAYDKSFSFNKRAGCSGNFSAFLVLPDGQVTLCEQTYWHPKLLLGDLTKQSIMEMWNSEKALALWNISQEQLSEDNPCKTCDIFDSCRRGKGVCWRVAYTSYGLDKYDFPVPQCPHSPKVTRDIFI